MHLPRATYRLQFNVGFQFRDAESLVDYLNDLGISDIYASPFFAAKKGSTNGYDVVDMNQINPELGGREGFDGLVRRLRQFDMHWLQDLVPNHQAFDQDNPMLMDVIENGRVSRYHEYFDINWNHPYENIRNRILAPFLGDFYYRCLERGELKLGFHPEGFRIHYFDLSLPICQDSYADILKHDMGRIQRQLGSQNSDLIKFTGLINFYENLDRERESNPEFFDYGMVKTFLWELYQHSPIIRAHVDANISRLNGNPGDVHSFDPLDELLSKQAFRLAFWKVGSEEMNYRRFFAINHLICLCVENENVFSDTHRMLFDLIRDGAIDGLRIDHIDGLYDPSQYLDRLRTQAPHAFLVVEKILGFREELPELWPVQGTTGYDFLNVVNGIFCDTASEMAIDRFYREFTGMADSYSQISLNDKRLIIGKHMGGDIDNLALMLKDVANRFRYGRDLTMYSVRRAIVEILAHFPVYRTYISPGHFDPRDGQILAGVIRQCREDMPILANELDLIGYYLQHAHHDGEENEGWMRFLMRLQQYTGPLVAKGVEDTAFYVFNRLCSRNEVGSDPGAFGVSIQEFHTFNVIRNSKWPHAMNTTATHDTKRGEDARARLNVLSEIPDQWRDKVTAWSRINAGLKQSVGPGLAPRPNDEYLLYQTLLGSLPFGGYVADDFPARLRRFLSKATREAKLESSWTTPNLEYENAFAHFAHQIMTASPDHEFSKDFLGFYRLVAYYGMLNSLSQVLLRGTCPGFPDLYQGCELWDLSLVDPDNRRPVNFARRRAMLDALRSRLTGDRPRLIHDLLADYSDGRIKMFVVHQVLQARKRFPNLFATGNYQLLESDGSKEDHIVAFARVLGGRILLVAAGRFFSRVYPVGQVPLDPAAWGDTCVKLELREPTLFVDQFTGESFTFHKDARAGQLFAHLPLALLISA